MLDFFGFLFEEPFFKSKLVQHETNLALDYFLELYYRTSKTCLPVSLVSRKCASLLEPKNNI